MLFPKKDSSLFGTRAFSIFEKCVREKRYQGEGRGAQEKSYPEKKISKKKDSQGKRFPGEKSSNNNIKYLRKTALRKKTTQEEIFPGKNVPKKRYLG